MSEYIPHSANTQDDYPEGPHLNDGGECRCCCARCVNERGDCICPDDVCRASRTPGGSA